MNFQMWGESLILQTCDTRFSVKFGDSIFVCCIMFLIYTFVVILDAKCFYNTKSNVDTCFCFVLYKFTLVC